MQINSVQDLIVWERGIELVRELYELTLRFPKQEMYGLTSQIRRAAVSVPANIAEGYGRGTRKDYAHFVSVALGSARELETLLVVSREVKFVSDQEIHHSRELLDECCRMLKTLRRKLTTG